MGGELDSDVPGKALDQILADYMRRVDRGEQVDQQALIAAHPAFAAELREYFSQAVAVERIAVGPTADFARQVTLHGAPEVRCPNCHAPTALAPGAALIDLTCSACGTHLSYFGAYELLEEIARGGMGVVFKARQVSLDRILAVKMILAGQLANPQDIERFRAEAEAAANLNHPNIVAVHEIGEHLGQQYFSMDYVQGKSLAEIVRDGPLPARKAASYVKQIAVAIHYAHEQGVLHRDLKPSNVLIDADGNVRITDFGLAKRIDRGTDLTVTGAVLGTPAYMPPEQAAGRRGDMGPASDIYSLGAVLYELLTGRPPYRGETAWDTLLQILEAEPIPPRSLNPAIPVDLATICLKCMERHPARRYTSAAALANDLDRFLDQQPILARPAGPVRKVWGVSKRRPWLFAALAASVGMVLLGVAYWLWAENAFLRYKVEHPEYVRKLGAMNREVRNRGQSFFPVFMAISICAGWFSNWFRRRRRRRQPIPVAILTAYGAAGIAMILSSLYAIARMIDASVWEGSGWAVEDLAYLSYLVAAWFGTIIVAEAMREYEISAFGSNEESTLSAEQLEAARSLILDKKFIEARRFCNQVSASKRAGGEVYGNLMDALVDEYPDKLPELTIRGRIKATLLKMMLIYLLVSVGVILSIYIFLRFW